MIKYWLRVIKTNPLGNKEIVEIPLPGLTEVMTPQEIFAMEFKLNELPKFRFHIETHEE